MSWKSLCAMVATCFVVGICSAGEVQTSTAAPLDAGGVFPSPSGAYVATFTGEGFEIRDSTTGKVKSVRSLTPVFQAVWGDDSSTLLTLEHVAGGTKAVCFHRQDNGDWARFAIEPPGGPFDGYLVKRWTFDKSGMKITYRTRSRKQQVSTIHEVSFDFDPRTNAITHATTIKVDE